VENACSAPCASSSDCLSGQTCQHRTSDHGTTGSFCIGATSHTSGTDGDPCKASSDCDERYGYHCVGSTCTLTCEVHSDCAKGSCTGTATDTEHHAVRTCVKDTFPRGPGQYGTACPNGTECDKAQNFTCIGAGPGDIYAYCTQKFCAADGDCPSGSFCARERAKEQPCPGTSCNLPAGVVTDAGASCVGDADIGPGKHFTCGPLSLITGVCLRRDFCVPCTTDTDCLGEPNQVCADDGSGQKICTVLCDPAVGSCPWGSAAACNVFDKKLGVPTCAHRFGSCHGTGKSCEPCVDESDCPNGICEKTHFSGEQYCVDLTVSCSCPSGTTSSCAGGGCPTTPAPASLTMDCLGGSDYAGSPLQGKCFGANSNAGSQGGSKESCWPSL
jgi:hypothetical protein